MRGVQEIVLTYRFRHLTVPPVINPEEHIPMPTSRNASPWYRLHHSKPHEGKITLYIISTGHNSIDPPPSLPLRLARELKRLLPAGCKRHGRASICRFTHEPTVARTRPSVGIGVRLDATIQCEEAELMKQLETAGFQPLPPHLTAHYFL
jgi:hypothetical protein